MTNNTGADAGAPSSLRSSQDVSPAARKFAEYLARRLVPKVEHAARQQQQPAASTGADNAP